VLAVRMLALSDMELLSRYDAYCRSLTKKIEKANADLALIKDYKFKTN
jgi:5-(carboxyamino)imidazole ribonucleotide mutase